MKNLKILLLLLFIWPGNAYSKTKHDLRQSWQEIVKYKFLDQDTLHLVEYYVDEMKLISALSRTPLINKKVKSEIVMSFPSPEGKFISFEMYESPVLPKNLSENYPKIKTFTGRGLDNSNDRVSVTLNNNYFKVLMLCSFGRIFINPIINTSAKIPRYQGKVVSSIDSLVSFPFMLSMYNEATAIPLFKKWAKIFSQILLL